MSTAPSNERYRLVEDAFQRTLDQPPEQRADFLARLCGSDVTLRAEVEALLHSYAASDGRFDRPLYERPLYAGPDPVRIGRYQVLRRLGQGGMAVVFEATQAEPQRSVALKMIRPDACSDRTRRRFEFEAAVLGRLQHPGIAQIFEAGLTEVEYPGGGRVEQPFFAMELVQGEALTSYMQRTGVGLAERLALFIRVCEAVEHAHRKGVIHRDLKPANIVVTAAGQPKVLDFGVARMTEADLQWTCTLGDSTALAGTLPYMSPEQVAGQAELLDTRSDVYALGILLYELLAGRLPYNLAALPLAAAARVVAEQPPTPLRAVTRVGRGDLEVIVAKALEKEPARRYASVQALADDVRRVLRHEPIAARPAGAWYSLRKFIRRNRALTGALVLTLAALLIGLSSAAVERDRKDAALRSERLARGEAEAIATFLSTMLSAADPKRQGREARVVDLLDAAAAEVSGPFADQPLIEARLRHVIGVTYQQLGAYDLAEPHLLFAHAARTQRLGARHPDALDSLRELGVLYRSWGRPDTAEPLAEHALAWSRAELGSRHPQTYAALHELGQLRSGQGRYSEAQALLQEAWELGQALHGAEHPATLSTANSLGLLWRRMGRYNEALHCYTVTLAARQRTLGTEHPDTLVSMNNLAHLYRALGRLRESAELHERTLALRRSVLGDRHPQSVMSMDNLAMVLADLERSEEAEALYSAALEHKRRIYGDDGPETLITLTNLARNYASQGRHEQAGALLEQVLEARRRVLGEDHPQTLDAHNDLATALLALERVSEAEQHYQLALSGRRRTLGPEHPETLKTLINLAHFLRQQGRLAEAELFFVEALEGYRRTLGPDHPDTINQLTTLGVLLRDLGRGEEAAAYGAEAAQHARRVLADRWEAGIYLFQYARTLAVLERFEAAEAHYLEAHNLLECAQGAQHPRTTRCIAALLELYDAWRRVDPGQGVDARAAVWRAALTSGSQPQPPGPAPAAP